MPGLEGLRKTGGSKHILVARTVAGAPLALFGLMHLAGVMPMKPLLKAAGMPGAGVMAIVAPLGQLAAGLLLLSGAFARIGAVLAIGTMLGALHTHVQIPGDGWPESNGGPEEPVFMMGLAAVIIVASGYVLWRGAGGLSVDYKAAQAAGGADA